MAAPDQPPTAPAQPQPPVAPAAPLMPPAPAPAPPPSDMEHEREHMRHLGEVEFRLHQEEERHRRAHEEQEGWWGWTRHVKISGYLQPQLLWQWFDSSASPNPAGQDSNAVTAKPNPVFGNAGTSTNAPITTNGDYFRLRRARLKVELEPNEYSRFVMEIDPVSAGGPAGGIGTIARNVEAQGIAHWNDDVVTTFGVGIFKIPFGWEVLQSDADRPFIERSWWEQNVTPGEFDTGAKAYTTAFEKRFTGQVAVVNGITQGEPTFAVLPDLNKGKDLVGRVNYNFGPVDVGASGYYGQGQVVNLAALSFKQFPRYAWNIEAALHHKLLPIGETRILAEFDRGMDMDRGVKYAFALPTVQSDINANVIDHDELGYWIRAEQDITRWATLAFRYDYYTPDSAQATNGRDTYAAVGVWHITRNLQYMIEGNIFIDNVHDTTPGKVTQPAGKHGQVLSNVLQVRFP
jgi:hypothetical protein